MISHSLVLQGQIFLQEQQLRQPAKRDYQARLDPGDIKLLVSTCFTTGITALISYFPPLEQVGELERVPQTVALSA